MNVSRRLSVVSFLAFVGWVVSLYQTHHFFQIRSGTLGFQTFCSFGESFDCNVVELSRWAEGWAGLPLSGLAAAGFLAIGLIALIGRNRFWEREMVRVLFVLSSVAFVTTLFYFGVMAWVLKKYCLLCLTVDGINLANWILILSCRPEAFGKVPADRAKWKTAGSLVLASGVVMAVMVVLLKPTSVPRAELNRFREEMKNKTAVSIPVDASMPAIGAADPAVTIVKFSDFQCPSCKHGALAVHPVVRKYSERVRYVYRFFPLSSKCNRMVPQDMHPAACAAAYAAYCAHRQGKFEAMYERIFEAQERLYDGIFEGLAQTEGLNLEQFRSCMGASETREAIARDIEEGLRLSVQSTPTFFVNGKMIAGSIPTSMWFAWIEELLAGAGTH